MCLLRDVYTTPLVSSLLFVDMASQSPSTNPIHEELTSNDLSDLLNTLNPVASKCYYFGLQLGVEDAQIRNIMYDYGKGKDQLREILRERLKQESPLTWHDIVTALRADSVREYSLASEIEHRYIHCQHPPVSTESSAPKHGNCSRASFLRPCHSQHDPDTLPSSPQSRVKEKRKRRNEFPGKASSPSKRTKVMEYRTDKPLSGIEEKRTRDCKQTTREELRHSLEEGRGGKERESGSKSEVREKRKEARANSSSKRTKVMKYDTDESPPEMTTRGCKHAGRKDICQSSDDEVRSAITSGSYGRSQKRQQLRGCNEREKKKERRGRSLRESGFKGEVREKRKRRHDHSGSRGSSLLPSSKRTKVAENESSSGIEEERGRGLPARKAREEVFHSSGSEVVPDQIGEQEVFSSHKFTSECDNTTSGKRFHRYESESSISSAESSTFSSSSENEERKGSVRRHVVKKTKKRKLATSFTPGDFRCGGRKGKGRYLQHISCSQHSSRHSDGRIQPQPVRLAPDRSQYQSEFRPSTNRTLESSMQHFRSPTYNQAQSNDSGVVSKDTAAVKSYHSFQHSTHHHQYPPQYLSLQPPTYRPPYPPQCPPPQHSFSTSGNSSPQTAHTTPQVQPPSMQPMTSHVGWVTSHGHPSYIQIPHVANPIIPNPNNPRNIQSSSSGLVRFSAKHTEMKLPMDKYIHYIKATYKQCEIEKSLNAIKWPPTPSRVFINLACIDWETVVTKEEADECTRAMVEDGNVDVIMKKKRNISFDDIVRDLPATAFKKVVLVEGAPGVGKSTFAWEFCRRWERGEIAQQYQLVLLLRLRDDRMSRAESLGDLIYHPSSSIHQCVVEELESTLGVNVLIILEGFDELPDFQRQEPSIFLQLILGQLLPFATILVTSRPWSTSALLRKIVHRIFQHIEVLGFTEENIRRYVSSVFTDEKTTNAIEQSVGSQDEVSEEAKKNIDDVMTYLATYPQIKACMYIPLNAAIVVSIHKESKKGKCILPKTLTELYYALTQVLLLRYLYGHPEYSQREWNVQSFQKDLPAEVYTQLLSISKLAYDGICIKRGKRVQLIFSDLPAGFETLGFMQSVAQVYVQHGQKTSHNFLHLTVQEFLAARHISTMSPAEQLKHFQRHKDGRLRVVLRFLAGITELKNVTHEQLRGLLGKPDVRQGDGQQTLHCKPMRPDVCVEAHHTNWLFEAQNTDLLQSLLHNHTTSFTFTKAMLPLEYYSVGYCIAHSHSNWSLTFEGRPKENKVRMLVSGAETGDIQQSCVALKTARSMTTDTLHLLFTCFSGCVEELYLRISRGMTMSLSDLSALRILELSMGMVADVSDFSSNRLESLTIIATSMVTFCNTSCEAIGKYLSSTCFLKTCHLRAVDGKTLILSNDGLEAITKGMSDNIALPLESLEIDCMCTFTTTATRSLAQFITRSTTLQYLRLCSVTFNVREFIELLVAVNHSSSLQEKKLEKFDILCSDMSTEEDRANLTPLFNCHPDLVHIQSSLSDTTSLEQSNNTCIVSAVIFALNHNYCKTLRLKLHKNGINYTGAVALAQTLHHNSTLEWLYLPNNSISDAGAVALAQALHHNSTLKRLDLSESSISDAGTVALAQALHHNSTLKGLYLYNNSISDTGAVALAQALHRTSTLVWLDLSGNDAIGEEGTCQLVQSLSVNTSISRLTLPKKCTEYAKQCTEYDTVKNKIW